MGNFFSFLFSSSDKDDSGKYLKERKIEISKHLEKKTVYLTFHNKNIALQWTCHILDKLIEYNRKTNIKCLSGDININDKTVTIDFTDNDDVFYCDTKCKNVCNNFSLVLGRIPEKKERTITFINVKLYGELIHNGNTLDEFNKKKSSLQQQHQQGGGYMQNKLNYLKLKKLQ
jgi:hypothetical protein